MRSELRVLLVEGSLSEARFIEDALSEMQERTQGGAWVHCDVTHLEMAADAALVLESEPPDIVLYNPALPDSRGMDTFRMFHDAAPATPLVALLEAGEEGLGRRMLRQGAQDFILKSEIDCQPLARIILNAIERQRCFRATQLLSAVDLETGFYNRESFRDVAARDIHLACESGQPVTLLIAEVDDLMEVNAASGRQAAHHLILEAANVVRAAAGLRALVARSGLGQFTILEWSASANALIAGLQTQVQAGHHPFAFVFGDVSVHTGWTGVMDDLIATAEAMLYENKQAYSNSN